MKTPAAGLQVFRDAGRELAGPALLAELRAALEALPDARGPRRGRLALDALLRAGELECGLADLAAAGSDAAAGVGAAAAARITDAFADALVGDRDPLAPVPLDLGDIHPPAILRVGRPEGFAYYALHPLDLSRLADSLSIASGAVGVIGVRTIGTTLSAVVAAALRRRGLAASRLTVRPGGHPWDRRLDLAPAERRRVHGWIASGDELLVVDEGPGLSGSTFLSVGEALVAEGASPDRITFLCTGAPDPDRLTAPDAPRRARRFRWRAVSGPTQIPPDAGTFVGGGAWRRILCPDASRWPPCWPTFERLKYLSLDGRRLHKFEGLCHHGVEVQERVRLLADAGFGPPPRDEGDGFLSYPILSGRPLASADLSRDVLDFLADYCAFRAAEIPALPPDDLLEAALHDNLAALELAHPPGLSLAVERPVIPDARMMPHELLGAPAGVLLKVDAGSHGDDHFLPGPTDIAWDLAAAIVEWRMDAAARLYLLQRYHRASGDHAAPRLHPYIVAYAASRLALTRMAEGALRGSDEAPRLVRDLDRYRAVLDAELQLPAAPRSRPPPAPPGRFSG